MATSEVTLAITDWTAGSDGKKIEISHISMNLSIVEVKKAILQGLEKRDVHPDAILLFMGSMCLEDEKLLKDYNRSHRSKLSLDVRERSDLNLRIKTLQHGGAGGCACVPLWAYFCRQTILIDIPDHRTVGDLKKRVAEELNDPQRYTADKIKLVFCRDMLFDDSKTLKEIGLQKDSTLTLFVDCCYWANVRTPPPAADKPADQPVQAQQSEGVLEDTKQNSGVKNAIESEDERPDLDVQLAQ
ncbi:hypothetical protein Efla_003710 [Eimeria flavescens]